MSLTEMKKFLFICIFAVIGLAACEMCRDMRSVGVNEFKRYIKRRNVVVIDVRTPDEHKEGYIPGTDYNFNALDDSFESMILENIPHESNVAIYCRSGNRSKTAGAILVSNCYNVVELESGFKGWTEAGKPIAK